MQTPASSAPPADDTQQPTPLYVNLCRPDSDTLVVTPVGEADFFTLPSLQQALTQVMGRGQARVVVDLDHLSFMDASTLGALVDANERISAEGGIFQIRCRSRQGRRLLFLIGLDRVLERADAGLAASD